MEYIFETKVKEKDNLRASFNELTRKTFCFDFEGWYEAGHWGDFYIPHVLLDGEKVVSNVSVNLMQFDVCGVKKNYIQLGTVMTDEAYRGQGLNREIMEKILTEYIDKVDGIYLFGNDDVLNYYPKFGFKPAKEYEYYMPLVEKCGSKKIENTDANPYTIKKINLADKQQAERLYQFLYDYKVDATKTNQNDSMYMNENVCLYQFWFAAGYGDSIYYVEEMDAYVVADVEEGSLHIHQIFGKQEVDVLRLAKAFECWKMSECENVDRIKPCMIEEIVLGFTPAQKEKYLVREHKEEDCTLFILGEDLEYIEDERCMFSVLSHA